MTHQPTGFDFGLLIKGVDRGSLRSTFVFLLAAACPGRKDSELTWPNELTQVFLHTQFEQIVYASERVCAEKPAFVKTSRQT